jgi:hypothetical protein
MEKIKNRCETHHLFCFVVLFINSSIWHTMFWGAKISVYYACVIVLYFYGILFCFGVNRVFFFFSRCWLKIHLFSSEKWNEELIKHNNELKKFYDVLCEGEKKTRRGVWIVFSFSSPKTEITVQNLIEFSFWSNVQSLAAADK